MKNNNSRLSKDQVVTFDSIYIRSMYITILGKIESLKLHRPMIKGYTPNSPYREEWNKLVNFTKFINNEDNKGKELNFENATITPDGIIELYDNITCEYIVVHDTDLELDDISISLINYDEDENVHLKTINYIILKANSEFNREQLIEMGLTPIKDDEQCNEFKVTVRDLYQMLNRSIPISDWFLSKYDIMLKGKQLTFTNMIGGTTYTKDNTALEKLEIWKNKMKALGKLDDYIISLDGRTLSKYKGNDSKLSLPPVRFLLIHDVAVTVKELKIPSTVEYISGIRPSILKVDISNATNLHLVGDVTGFVTEDKRIVTNNIIFEKTGDMVSIGLTTGELEVPALQLASISYKDRAIFGLIKIHDRKN